MSKTFSCDVDNCVAVFTKKSDLKKHIVEHTDPSKVFRCTEGECEFSTLYSRGFDIHKHSHSNARPYACPDRVKDPACSDSPGGISTQPSVSEKACTFRSNCPSALLKHRVARHGYKPNPRPRRGARKISRVDRRARSSPYSSLPLPPKKPISSNRGASCSSKYNSACADPTVTPPPSSMVQPLDNNHCYPAPDARYGEVSNNNPIDLEANLIDANSSVASQNNYTHHGGSPSAFPILQNSPATALHQNSFEPPHNVKPSRREAESTDLDPGAYWTANSYNSESESAGSYAAFAPGPFDERLSAHPTPLHYYEASNGNAFAFAQESTNASSSVAWQYYDYTSGSVTALPFPLLPHNPSTVSHHDFESFYDSTHTCPDPPHDVTTLPWLEESITHETQSTDSGSVTSYTSNQGSSPNSSVAFPPSPEEIPYNNVYINASSSVAPSQLNHSANHGVAFPAPSLLAVPETLVDGFNSSGATDTVPSFLDFETEIHEDEIFFRGTGREGCLCPEMMISAGVEGWDGSLLDTQQPQHYSYSLP